LALVAAGIGWATWGIPLVSRGQTLALESTYLAGLNTDTTNTVEVARNFAAILGGPLTGSGGLTLKGGFASTLSSMLSLINNEGNTFSGNLTVDMDGGTLRLSGHPYTTGAAIQGAVLPGMTSAHTVTVRPGSRFEIEDNITASASGYAVNRLGSDGNRPALRLESGTFNYSASYNAAAMTQTLSSLTLGNAYSTINVTRNHASSTPKLIFADLAADLGATVNFTGTSLGTAEANVAQILFQTPPSPVGGILPGYIRTGNEWATHGANGITALATYGGTIQGAGATDNIKVTGAQTITGNNTINSLNWNLNGDLNLGTNALTLVSGAYLKQNNNANNLLGTTGYVTAGAGNGVLTPLYVYQNAGQNLAWSALVRNNPAGSSNVVAFVKDGSTAGTVTFSQAADNDYSGGTFVNAGALTITATANRRYLGTGPVVVDNAALILGHIGATANATGPDYSIYNGGYVSIPNYAFTADDTFYIGPRSLVYGAAVSAGTGLNSLDRGIGGSAYTNIVLAEDAIIGHPALAAPLNLAIGSIRNLGTAADLYYGIAAAQNNTNGAVTIGTGTPFKGISTQRGTVTWHLGTIEVGTGTSDIYLQGMAYPGAVPSALTLGNTAPTVGGPVIRLAGAGTVNANIIGSVILDDDAAVFGDTTAGKLVNFVVTPGATLQVYSPNALGSGSGIASATVQRGGTLQMTLNPAGLSGATTVQRGGRLLANNAGGLTGTGALTFEAGSILEVITALCGFSGAQAAAATLAPGTIVRLNLTGYGSPVEPLDTYLGSKSPIYVVMAGLTPVNPATADTTVMTLNRSAGGVGGMLVNDLFARTISAVLNGKIVIGPNGGVMAASTNTILTVAQRLELGANELIIGSPTSVDGTAPLLGKVTLMASPNYNTATNGSRITVVPSATLGIGAADVLPDAADVVVNGTLSLAAADAIGSLSGSGLVDLVANTLTIGRNNVSTNFSGRFTGTTGGIVKSGTNRQDLAGAGSTWSGAGTVRVTDGILALSGNGELPLSGTTAFTLLGGGTLLLDNSGVNDTDRLTGTAPGITFQGGTFRFSGKNGQAASESLGVATPSSGASTVEVINGSGAGSSAEVVFSGFTAGAGTVNFVGQNGTLGWAGDHPRVKFTAGVTAGTVANWATVGGVPAYYDATYGLRAFTVGEGAEFNGGTAQTLLNTVFTAANTSPMELLTAARTVNSLWIDSPGAGKYIDLGSTGSSNLTITSGRLSLTGNDDFEIRRSGSSTGGIAQSANRLFINTEGSRVLTVGVPVTGTGGISKDGTGVLVLNATSTWTTGALTVNDGEVRYGAASDLAVIPLTIWNTGKFDVFGKTDTLGAVTIYSGGITNSVAGGDLTVASLTMGAGPAGSSAYVQTGSGLLRLGGDVTYSVLNDPGTAVIGGNLHLNGATRTFTVGNSVAADAFIDLNVPAKIDGAATHGITKALTGTLRLGGANTFDGPVSITGTLIANHPQALGTPSATRTFAVAAASSLVFDGSNGNITVPANYSTVSLNGAGNTLYSPISGALINQSGSNTVPGAITLAAATQVASLGGKLTLGGNMTAVNLGLTTYGEGDLDLGGVLGLGTGTLIKNGGGTLTLSGAGANTFSGATTVNGGTLLLNKQAGVNAIPGAGAITVNSGGRVKYSGNNNMIGDAVAITLNGSGQLDFNGSSDTIGNMFVYSHISPTGVSTPLTNSTGGGTLTIGTLTITPLPGFTTTLDTGSGTLKLGGDVTFSGSGTGKSAVRGNLDLGAATRTLTISFGADGPGTIDFDVPAVVTGAVGVGIVKAGTCALRLGGSNTFDGPIAINAGTLRLSHSQALGVPSTTRAITVASGTSLVLDGVGIADPVNRFTLSLNGGGSSLVGPVYGALVSQFGNNTVPQAVTLVTTAPTIASLTPGDTLTMTGTISSVNLGLTVTGNGNTDLNGPLALGSGTLTKNGNGTLRLMATNTYSGATTLSGGRTEVNGLIGAGAVTVNAGATFGGSGTVSGAVTVASGGVFAPGAAGVGVLQMATNLTLNNGAVFESQLNPLGDNTRVQVGGNLVLTSTWTLRLKDGGGTADLTDRIVFLTYSGVLTTFGNGQIDASALDPLLWDASGATLVNDYMNKQVYVTGLRYIGPRVEVNDVTVTEGDAGTVNAVFTVSVAGGATNVTVNFASTNDTAASGTDYTATNGALSIAGGATTSATVTVSVAGDTADEWPSERFFLNLSNAQNARLARWRGVATIRDDDAAFTYRMPITFTGYTGTETLVNYPALVKLNETVTNFNYSQFLSPTSGRDLRFTDGTGTRELNYEIEQWTVGGDSFVWVKVPELASTNTTIWAMWGDPARVAAPAYTTNGATWSANFLAVWHLHAVTNINQFQDSTPNAFHGTNLGVVAASGRIGGAQDFTGARRVDVSALSFDGQWNSRRSYTFEFWVKSPQTTTRGYLFDALTGRLIPMWNEPAAGQIGYYDGVYRGGLGSGLNNDQWQHLAFVFDGHAPTGTLYANGVALGSLPYSPVNLLGTKSLGSAYNGFTQPFDGLMDEARVTFGTRSADWIRADAMNQSDPAAFTTFGAVESGIDELIVRNRDATEITAHSATLNGVLLHTGPGGPADVYFGWGTANGGDTTSGWQRVDWLGGGWTAGQFVATNITELKANQTYWYRAFAVDSQTNARALEAISFITRRGRYVALSGNGSAGTNWATAFTSLQTALNVATSGVEDIYIAGGDYAITNELLWTNSGLRVMGGYEGVGTPGAADPTQWPTVLARPASTTNRIFSILNVSNAWLRGVTIRNGYRSRSDVSDFGGGLYITNSDLMIDTCVIHTNHVQPSAGNLSSFGGGIYSLNSTLIITNCLFRENRLSGGGVSSTGVGDGSAIFATGGRVTVTDSEFIGNVGASIANQRSTGTIYLNGGVPVVRRTRIVGNTVNGAAGGIYMTGANLSLVEDSVIQNNFATIHTGGIWMNGGTVRNSLIASNSTQNTAGGVNLQGDTARLQNVTVVHNATTNAMTIAGIHIFKGIVENTISYFNTRVYDNLDVSISSDSGTVSYACTMPLRVGTGNTASDPDFMVTATGNFRLRPGSPAEDTATLLDWMDGATDLAGLPRILNQGPDMGCYETGIPDVPLMINFAADRIAGLDSLLVTFTSLVTGNATNGLTYYWDFDNDGDFDEQGMDKATVQHPYGPGIHSVRLRVTNDQTDEEISTRTDYIFVSASEIYVSQTGDGSDGLSWATAFTNLQQALDFASGSNTLYIAGQTFTLNASLMLGDRRDITLRGGYEANVATVGAGPYDVDQWATVLRRNAAAGTFRIIDVTFVKGVRFERLTFADGNTTSVDAIPAPGSGGALRFIDSVVDIADCVFSNNQANTVGNGFVYGGAIYFQNSTGTVTRTRFSGNRARNISWSNVAGCFGGGLSASGGRLTVLDSVFVTNSADAYGHHGSYGGAIHMTGAIGLVSNVLMIGNQASPNRVDRGFGGGIYITAGMQVMDCVIVSNRVWNAAVTYGGGGVFMSGGLLRNSLVADNQCTWDGGGLYASGGIIESVTVAGNRNTETEKTAGAFLSGSVVVSNSIFASNIRQFDSVDASVPATGGTLTYSLTRPFRSGTGNVDGEPGFANVGAQNYRLGPGSPAIDAGLELDWMSGALDIDRNSRVSGDTPDLGCFETQEGGQGPLAIAFTADTTLGLDALRVIFTAAVSGSVTNGLDYFWDFDNDGTNDMTGIDLRVVTNDYFAGRHSVRLRVTSTTEESSLIRSNYIHVSSSAIYVSQTGDGSDGLSWATAFNAVQNALDFAAYSNTIYVAGGTYSNLSSLIWSGHTDVRIRGGYEGDVATVGPGPRDTALWPTRFTRNSAGGNFRVMMVSGVASGLLEQITIAGGNTTFGGETPVDIGSGGGMRILNSSLEIADCIFSNNQANSAGNGVGWGGALFSDNSTVALRGTRFESNRSRNTSGSNNARTLGGALAARGGALTAWNCEFRNNEADSYGHYGSWGGAIYTESTTGWIRNALVTGNRAGPNRTLGLGGGIYLTAGMTLENATVVSNQVWNPSTTAGGIYATGGAISNTIAFLNSNITTAVASDVYSADLSRFSYSCAAELTAGVNNNISDNPLFVNAGALNFQLQQESPCLNRGRVQPWMASTLDLIGNARVAGGGVDMGAYELLPPPGTMFIVR
jgi:autotransporter-associated beta strand protein